MANQWPVLSSAPVSVAIFQLKFNMDSIKLDDFNQFDSSLKHDFNKRNVNIHANITIPSSTRIPLGKSQIQGETDARQTAFEYFTTDQKQKFVIGEGSITYTSERKYDGWNSFKETVLKYLRILSPVLEKVTVTRTSIRFINQFQFEEFSDPSLYFKTLVTATSDDSLFSHNLLRYGFRLTLDLEPGIYANVNQNAERINEDYSYVFDIDVLNHSNLIFQLNSISDILEHLREYKNEIFFNNITDKTIDLCNSLI